MEVTPSNLTLPVQDSVKLEAVARDEFGNVVAGVVQWEVAAGGGSIDSDGLFTAGTVADTVLDAVKASLQADADELVNEGAVPTIGWLTEYCFLMVRYYFRCTLGV